MKNLLFAAATFCTLVLFSCGSSCDLESFAKDAEPILELGNAYNADPTKENCDAYAAQLQSVIDDYGDCEAAEIMSSVDVYRSGLAALNCE